MGAMLNGLYSAAAGMDAAQARHETAAMNLASAQQPGFRRTHLSQNTFEAALVAARQKADKATAEGLAPTGDLIDFREGPLELTGRSLDFALQGDGFFVVEGRQRLLYSRNGRFHLNEAGELVTVDGLRVQGAGGAIRIPSGSSTESLQVTAEGRIIAEGAELGRLDIVRFADPQQLVRAGKSLFAAPGDMTAEPSEATVAQGMLEGANVSAVTELIELIAASRQYEAAAQSMRSITESTARNINSRGGN
jgi:flagellar basal body rod protein FlgG